MHSPSKDDGMEHLNVHFGQVNDEAGSVNAETASLLCQAGPTLPKSNKSTTTDLDGMVEGNSVVGVSKEVVEEIIKSWTKALLLGLS